MAHIPDGPDQQRLVELLNALLVAEHAEKRRLLESEADVLLHPAAEMLLRREAEHAAAGNDEEKSRVLIADANLLAVCRERGVTTVWREFKDMAITELEAMLAESSGGPDRGRLHRQVQLCSWILTLLSSEDAAETWADVQANMGNALQSLGSLSGDTVVLRAAEQAYRAALEVRTRDNAPLDWAMTQTNLANVLVRLGELSGDTVVLRAAEQACCAALEVCTREREPMDWAKGQTCLGTVLARLGELTGDPVMLRAAEQAYRAALEVCNRDHAPMDWAMTQNNVGNVLQSLGDLTGDTAVLHASVQAYRAALEFCTRDRAPIVWAATQTNLGNVLQSLGELTGDAAMMRSAEQAHGAALEVRTRDHASTDWATTQNNLGNVLSRLGDLTGDAAMLRAAEQAYRAALEVRTHDRAPIGWAMTQNNLGNALVRLGALTGDAAVLRAAEQAYRAALEVRTRDHAPIDWAMTQNNLGNVLMRLGELTGPTAVLRAAEQAYRAALEVRTRNHAPMDWAATQTNLGNVLLRLGELTGDAAVLRAAEQSYRAALEVLDSSGAEETRQGAAGRLAHLMVRQLRYGDAAAVITPTLARSDAAIMDAARSPDGRARAVEQVGDLYALLSLCRLRQDTPDREAALIAAESGRARLLADAVALDAVRPENIKDLYIRGQIDAKWERLAGLRVQLGYDRIGQDPQPRELSPDKRTRLQEELRQASDAYVAVCRTHGLIRTPEPLMLDQIVAAAPAGGALVLLVLPLLIETSAFAFVISAGTKEVSVIDLPHLDGRAVRKHLNGKDGWVGIYGEHFRYHDDDGDEGVARRSAEARWHEQLIATQAWLWERLLKPVHEHLRDSAKMAPGAPVVLLAPGLLSLLPLQAAGPGPDGLYFGDHWTVSFAPSVRSLLTCQQRLDARRNLPAKLLAVIDPPSKQPLLGAQQEAPMLRQRFEHAEPIILADTAATLAAVLEHLPTATYFHASTHGSHDWREPTRSGLHLADTPLRLEMLRDTKLEAARLVFLSACESGRAGVRKLPDEFIGLPAGFVQAGAACVVGSLWPIRDDAAFLLASKFYDLHLDERGHERLAPAAALTEAQVWLRDLTFADLRKRYPVAKDSAGRPCLLVSTAARFIPVADNPAEGRGIALLLGPDDERPYAAPQHWAAFTVTGY